MEEQIDTGTRILNLFLMVTNFVLVLVLIGVVIGLLAALFGLA